MRIFGHQTQFRGWLMDLIIDPKDRHPKRCFWYATDGWSYDSEEIKRAIMLDDDLILESRVDNDS